MCEVEPCVEALWVASYGTLVCGVNTTLNEWHHTHLEHASNIFYTCYVYVEPTLNHGLEFGFIRIHNFGLHLQQI